MFKTKNTTNIQDLIKFIALIVMMIDHYGLYLDPNEQLFRSIGRFVFPIFAFYTGYNFHGKARHSIWILGVILMGLHIYIFKYFMPTILVTLAFGQLYLFYAGKAILADDNMFFRHFLAMLIFAIFTYTFFDYGTLGIAIMMVGYRYHNVPKKDEGYLLFALLCTVFFNEYTASQIFHNLWYAIVSVIAVAISGICLKYADHNKIIPVNLRPITRNMLYIYFVSIVGFIGVLYDRIWGFS